MNICIQGNLIIFAESGKCCGMDKPAKPCCQRDSEDYQKLKMNVMKKIKDKIIMAATLKNPAGSSRKAATGAGLRWSVIKNSGVFDKIPKGITLLGLLYRKSAAKPCWQRPARISKSERETVMKCIQINITIVRQAESERSEARSVSRTIPEMKSSGTPQKKHSGAVSLNVFPKDTPTKRSGICPCSVIRIVQESFFSFLLQYSNYQLLRKCSIPLKIEV